MGWRLWHIIGLLTANLQVNLINCIFFCFMWRTGWISDIEFWILNVCVWKNHFISFFLIIRPLFSGGKNNHGIVGWKRIFRCWFYRVYLWIFFLKLNGITKKFRMNLSWRNICRFMYVNQAIKSLIDCSMAIVRMPVCFFLSFGNAP